MHAVQQRIFCATGQALSDVSKDKVVKGTLDQNNSQFLKILENVESGLLKHINYLTTVSTGFSLCFLAVVNFQSFSFGR